MFIFSMQLIVNKIANYWIRTEKFLHQKQPLYNCAKSTAGNIGIFYVGCKYLLFFLSFFLSFFFFRKIADSTKHIFCFFGKFPHRKEFLAAEPEVDLADVVVVIHFRSGENLSDVFKIFCSSHLNIDFCTPVMD